MGILKRIKNLLSYSKPKNEIHDLNSSCNTLFEKIYKNCRIDFGLEFVELMDIKRALVTNFTHAKSCTPIQEMLAKKVIELTNSYFKYAEAVVSVKKNRELNIQAQRFIECTVDKMSSIYSLIHKLNSQFYIKSEGLDFETSGNDLIMEAEALNNVLEKFDKNKLDN
jgi:hypothetical protein